MAIDENFFFVLFLEITNSCHLTWSYYSYMSTWILVEVCINLSSELYAVQLLVEWTQGKNLIFSSGAPSVNELRGPYDVANLSSLLGLSMERAKAAISKNCRYDKLAIVWSS